MAQHPRTPAELYGELFTDVQRSNIFEDSKTFVDCIPKKEPAIILAEYKAIKNNPAVRFSMRLFVEENFFIPQEPDTDYVSDSDDLETHINQLWTVLRRKSDTGQAPGSLLPLPNDYIIPGGRFREIYYWDSYFTMLGLKESGETTLISDMIKNFSFLIDHYGHIPNGNRTYYLSRSQPPFFSLMLDLLAETKGDEVYATYLPALENEYNYWMDRSAATHHVIKMPDGSILNRYWDLVASPREESYMEDVSMAKKLHPEHVDSFFRDLRSAAESGWDFSSRWFHDGHSLRTIRTTSLIPVDLNCLLYHLELTLEKAYAAKGDSVKKESLRAQAARRKFAINKYCWSSSSGWYVDFDINTRHQSDALSIAGMFPYFLKVSDVNRFRQSKAVLVKKFLKAGGLVTTLVKSGQQWDWPNGWAPMQWISIIGLEQYGDTLISSTIARRWFAENKRVFKASGKLVEKYDVVDANKPGGGGEYPSQDGFGWTNGVLLAIMRKYNLH